MPNLAAIPQSALDSIVVSPEDAEEDMREVAKEYAEQLEEALKDALKEGALIFGKAKPKARMDYYMASTVLEDLRLILDPGYMDKLKGRQVPPPVSPMWLGLAALPDFVFDYFAKDWRDLLADHPEEMPAIVEGIRIARARKLLAQAAANGY